MENPKMEKLENPMAAFVEKMDFLKAAEDSPEIRKCAAQGMDRLAGMCEDFLTFPAPILTADEERGVESLYGLAAAARDGDALAAWGRMRGAVSGFGEWYARRRREAAAGSGGSEKSGK